MKPNKVIRMDFIQWDMREGSGHVLWVIWSTLGTKTRGLGCWVTMAQGGKGKNPKCLTPKFQAYMTGETEEKGTFRGNSGLKLE